jgi:hypothetical protein
MSTFNGLATSYYTTGSENITFCIRGEHNVTEDYYSLEVEGLRDHKGNVWVDGTDSNGFEYDSLVEACIAYAVPKGITVIF